MKKLAIFGSLLILAGCSASGINSTPAKAVAVYNNQDRGSVGLDAKTLLWRAELNQVVAKLKKRIGKTWYVFSGATPAGWDCSGLVMWTYEQMGVELPHSANKQSMVGQIVKDPQVGDIVVWRYKGYKSFYHAAIYIGGGEVIHAGFRKGTTTQVIPLNSPSFAGSVARFVRVTG